MKLSPAARVAKGALIVYLKPRLATDVAIDLDPILADLTSKNVASKRGVIAAAIQAQYPKHRLAQDADLSDLAEILEAVAPVLEKEEGDDSEANSGMPLAGHHFEDNDELPEFLKGKMAPEDCARAMDMIRRHADDAESEEEEREREEAEDRHWADDRARRADDARRKMGRDETPEEAEKRERDEGEARDRRRADDRVRAKDRRGARDKRRADDARRKMGRDETPEEERARKEREGAEDRRRADDRKAARDRKRADDVRRADDARRTDDSKKADDRRAMDAAVKIAVDRAIAGQRAIVEAREVVRPWVGSLLPTLAFDSADEVYRKALDMLTESGIIAKVATTVHPSAYRSILEMAPKPGQDRPVRQAYDAALPAGVKPAAERFAGAGRVHVMGG